MILPILLAQPDPTHENVSLDDERLQEDIPKGLHKVELDLDDALFLEFEEKEPAPPKEDPKFSPPPKAPEAPQSQEPAPVKPLWRKPLPWAALLGLLAIVGTALWLPKPWNASPPHQDPAALAPPTTPPQTAQLETPATPESTSTVQYRRTFSFAPFVLEHTRDNQTYFLTHQIYIPGIPMALAHEIEDKTTALRSEIYIHLQKVERNQLSGSHGNDELEKDLLAVVNKSLKNGQATKILVETRVVN